MKLLINCLALLIFPLTAIAQNYNISITKNDGTVTTIPSNQIDKIEFIPTGETSQYADLLDIVFNADGTATDMSPYNHQVITNKGAGLTTFYSDVHGKYVANFTHTIGSTVPASKSRH